MQDPTTSSGVTRRPNRSHYFYFHFSEFWMYNYFLRKFGLYEFVAQFMFEGFFSNFLFTGLA